MQLIQMADIVLTVSDKDRSSILEISPDTQVYTVGHVMNIDESRNAKTTFDQRNGILFIGSFHDSMYYNGDAVWYFLTEVYPLILKESKSPIPFTIAGENIPKDIHELVEKDKLLSKNVIFQESLADIDKMFDSKKSSLPEQNFYLKPNFFTPH